MSRITDATPNGAHAIGAFSKCEYRYYLGQVLRLSHREKSFPLALGTAWHRAMEAYYWCHALRETDGRCYKNRPHDDEFAGVDWQRDPTEQATEVALVSLGQAPPESEGTKVEEDWQWGHSWLPLAMRNYDAFARTFDVNSSQVYMDAAKEQPAIEVAFSVSLPGSVPAYTGRLDRVYRRGGLRVVQEHKTTAPQYLNLLEKKSRTEVQFGGYFLGHRALFQALPAYVELNAISKSANPEVYRRPIHRNIEEILYLQQLLNSIAGEITDRRELEAQGQKIHWRRMGLLNGFCVEFNRHCIFLPLCKAPAQGLNEWNLEAMYNVGTPLDETNT